MIGQLLAKVIGTQNQRDLKRLSPRVAEISALEPQIQPLTDDQLRDKTTEFRARLRAALALPDGAAFPALKRAFSRASDGAAEYRKTWANGEGNECQ